MATPVSTKFSASSGTHSGDVGGQMSNSGHASFEGLLYHRSRGSAWAFAGKQGDLEGRPPSQKGTRKAPVLSDPPEAFLLHLFRFPP